jgi:hypothetical protein
VAFSSGGDFGYSISLAAGAYRLAIGVFANLSFAENFGDQLTMTTPVPEPSRWSLLCIGLVVVLFTARHRATMQAK